LRPTIKGAVAKLTGLRVIFSAATSSGNSPHEQGDKLVHREPTPHDVQTAEVEAHVERYATIDLSPQQGRRHEGVARPGRERNRDAIGHGLEDGGGARLEEVAEVQVHVYEPGPHLQPRHFVDAVAGSRPQPVADLLNPRSSEGDVQLALDPVCGIDHLAALQNRAARGLDLLSGMAELTLPYRSQVLRDRSEAHAVAHAQNPSFIFRASSADLARFAAYPLNVTPSDHFARNGA
jgi:hypothetical protein